MSAPVESATLAVPAEEAARRTTLYAAIVGGVVGVDLATKLIVQREMRPYEPIPIVGDYFRLTYIFNPGAAFGLHVGEMSRFFFLGLSVAVVAMLFFWLRTTPWSDRLRIVAISAVTGGAVGNMIDRIRSPRGVIDFLDVGIGPLRWPVFNVADIAVTTGALLLAISLWREEREADLGGG